MDGRKRSSLFFGAGVFFVLSFCAASVCSEDHELTGTVNVCEKQELTTVNRMVAVREPTQVATKTWCMTIPPRCTTYRTVFKLVYKQQAEQTTKLVKRCCEGYTLHSNGTCVANCTNPCVNGQCMATNRCVCDPGFVGDTCTQKCPAAKWGPQCNNDCKCRNGATCDSINGKCQCDDGWRGEMCEEACPPGQYGTMCLQQCRCQNGAACDPMTGACKCQPGFCGPLCQEPCQSQVERICDQCQNGGHCLSAKDDKCTCMAGWMGDVCASPCEEGYWGNNCSKPCKICYNQGKCNPVLGVCKCPPGYQGEHCERQCAPGKFGPDCQNTCSCENAQAECDPITGRCHCFNGYKGDRCESRGCPDDLFGKFCNNTCHCSNLTSCHPIDGTCVCKLGWRTTRGSQCSMCCILTDGGPECLKDCGSTDLKYLCGPELDGCVCLNDYTGPECRVLGQDINNAALQSHNQIAKTNNTGLIVGLCIAVIVVVLILLLALFYRNRVRKLQNELASVTYGSSSGTDTDSDTKSEMNHADNMLYLGGGSSIPGISKGKATTTVVMKNGETFVKIAEPLPKKPVENAYVSMPNQNYEDRDSIYQSIEYEAPVVRHQYASIEETTPTTGRTNRAFENQLYNQKGEIYAPPSYESVITETMSSTHPSTK